MMKQRLEIILEEGFADLPRRLLERIETTLEGVEAWLGAEEEARRTLPSSGAPHLDEKVLKALLKEVRGRSVLGTEELERVEEARRRVGDFVARIGREAPRPLLLEEESLQRIRRAVEAHYAPYCALFRDLRTLEMERVGEYDPAVHDTLMAAFSWRDLTDREMALIPPVVVLFDADRPFVETASFLLGLFASSFPAKLLALRRHIDCASVESGRAAALRIEPDLGFFGLGLRGVYVLQATEAIGEAFDEEVAAALGSPRPALLSVWESPLDDPEEARLALASRTFPYLRYDPDLGFDCLTCLSIEKNPEPEEDWTRQSLPLPEGEEEIPITFAEYAWRVEGMRDQFEPLSEPGPKNPSLTEYLEMAAEERRRLRPYILVFEEGELLILVPSANILYRCLDKMRLWRCLQSMAGIGNPHTEEAVANLQDRFHEEEESLREVLEGRIEGERKRAVAEAVQALSLKLLSPGETGLGAGEIEVELPALPEGAPQVEGAEGAEAPGPSDLPWIETKLCTTCDECTRINKRIFAYNKDKQAEIKNPRGGPFRDIVKAAEKCQASIIHPGKPFDPNEKDLPKWIKRAKKYQ